MKLANLDDQELWSLHDFFRLALGRAPDTAMRAIAACLNEVDDVLAARGLLDLSTGREHRRRPR